MPKRLSATAVLLFATTPLSAEIFYDAFDYTPTQPLSSIQTITGTQVTAWTGQTSPYGPQWFPVGNALTDDRNPNITTPGLTPPGYNEGGTTNAVNLNGLNTVASPQNGSRIGIGPFGGYQSFSQPDLTLYYSFLLRVNDVTAVATGAGQFIAGFNTINAPQNSLPGAVYARLYMQRLAADSNSIRFGIGNSNSLFDLNNSYDVTTNNTFHVVASYTFSGAYNDASDIVKLWINPLPDTIGAAAPPAHNVQHTGQDASTGRIETFVFRPGGVVDKPNAFTADELRISTTWAGVTPPTGASRTSPTGNWSDPTAWSTLSAPNSPGAFVNLDHPSATTLNMDADRTIGTLNLNSPAGSTLSGPGRLSLSGSSAINAYRGHHTISSPLTLSETTEINIATAASLTTSNLTIAPGAKLMKFGAGTLTVNNLRADEAAIYNGAVKISPNGTTTGVSILKSLTIPGFLQGNPIPSTNAAIPPKGSLDLTDNALILEYFSNPAPLDTGPATNQETIDRPGILNLLRYAYNNGNWDGPGLTSSLASATNDPNRTRAIGYSLSSTLLGPAGGQFLGHNVDGTAILILPTYYGDANLNGEVDADDYALLDRSLAVSRTNPLWTDGDFNYDGTINNQDYLLIDRTYYHTHQSLSPSLLARRASQFGDQYVSQLLTSIPEPTSLLAACGLAFPLLLHHRRRTR